MNYFLSRPNWQLAIISGIFVGISYLPLQLGFLVYIGFIPLFHSWFNCRSKDNFKSGYIFGLIYNLISNYWMGFNSGADFSVVLISLIFAVLYLAIFWGIAGAIIGILRENVNLYIIVPLIIVSLEWIRSFGPLGFAWGNLALTQMEYLTLLQNIDIIGTYGLAFLIISVNLILYSILYTRINIIKLSLLILIIFIGLFISGQGKIKLFLASSDSFDIVVIQPNLDPNEKWDYSSRQETIMFMDSLYDVAISLEPDFILFPETAFPTYLRINKHIRLQLQSKVDNSGIPILVGTVDRKIEQNGKKLYFNSAIFLSPFKDYEMYEKIHLVPFAEYDLLPKLFHPLEKLNLNIDRGVFRGGTNFKVFKWEGIEFSDLICYESSFPYIARKFVQNGAKILLIQANDGWLGKSAGPYQHFELARLRAIENRIPIVRSGNTGISGVILPNGEVQKKVPLGVSEVFKETIRLYNAKSFYTRYGDVFATLCFVTFLIIGSMKCIAKKLF